MLMTENFYLENGLFRMNTSLLGCSFTELKKHIGHLPKPKIFPYWGNALYHVKHKYHHLLLDFFFEEDALKIVGYDEMHYFNDTLVGTAEQQFGEGLMLGKTFYRWEFPEQKTTFEMYGELMLETDEHCFRQRYVRW